MTLIKPRGYNPTWSITCIDPMTLSSKIVSFTSMQNLGKFSLLANCSTKCP
uniref:Uncharacterized protein n=1 Tax=Rhizophora mucronata TaxID=61149 RepID=A0A2P2IZX1_RHIMU